MNWHLGVEMVIDDPEVQGLLREDGVPLRTEAISSQMSPSPLFFLIKKGKTDELQLSGRTLRDLIPGKLPAVSVDSLEDFGVYDNERHLWTTLNPSSVEELYNMGSKQGKIYLNNRVGRYRNIQRNNPTELGNFYYCRYPDFLAGLAKVAEGLFAINVFTGLCVYY